MVSSITATHPQNPPALPAFAAFSGVLACAGLPIYIHAPKFFVDTYGVSLTALGTVLLGLRLIDLVQDPLFGWLSERTRSHRATMVAGAVAVMAASMIALFAVTPPIAPLWWFALALTGLFSAFSFLTISFYAQGVVAASTSPGGHLQLAAWRETGALIGVCLAAIAPAVLLFVTDKPFALFAYSFAALCAVAWIVMRVQWTGGGVQSESGLGPVLKDPLARKLLLIALLNATPVAVTSTLFLFFVESRLGAPGWEGQFLLLFFVCAALTAPLLGTAAQRFGARPSLLMGMALSILAFGFAATLGTGDLLAFGIICALSGAALGADMTLLPAIFSRRLAVIAPSAGSAFGLWSFVSKFTLAFAAGLLLPTLERSGFVAGADNDAQALWVLTLLYAVIPCFLKLLALGLLWATPVLED
ncbi:MAG: MFS transporter [Pseudomonadota bacterium]